MFVGIENLLASSFGSEKYTVNSERTLIGGSDMLILNNRVAGGHTSQDCCED